MALFEDRPTLAAELLRDLGLFPVDVRSRPIGRDGSTPVPVHIRADKVFLLERGDEVKLSIVLEVQLQIDETKRRVWPQYVVNVGAQEDVPAVLVVIAPDPVVARWAAMPIQVGPGFVLHPIVIGPEHVPRVTDLAEAKAAPELGVLSTLMHRDDAEVAYAGWSGSTGETKSG